MKQNLKDFLERLKVCWLVLTSHTYYTFFVSKPNEHDVIGKSKGCYITHPSSKVTDIIINFLKEEDLSE